MTITLCDICGKPLWREPHTEYKVKRACCFWPDWGWERIDVHDECVKTILDAKKFNADEFFGAERS